MALFGTAIPYTSTFFVFSDYMKPAIRLAALQNLHEIYVFTHDSFYVGEDGPDPRADRTDRDAPHHSEPDGDPSGRSARSGAGRGRSRFRRRDRSRCCSPGRISLPTTPKPRAKVDVARGAFVVSDDEEFDIVLVATGSEVNLGARLRETLCGEKGGRRPGGLDAVAGALPAARMRPIREEILPSWCPCYVSIEAGTTYGWQRFIGRDGLASASTTSARRLPTRSSPRSSDSRRRGVLARIQDHFVCSDEEDDECGCGCDCDCECDCDCDDKE